jgi:hypothetical protein
VGDLKDVFSLQLFFAFVVPGIIATYVRAQFLTGRIPSAKDNIFEIVVLSTIYYSVFIVLIHPLIDTISYRLYRDAAWIALTIVGPVIFGITLGIAAQRHYFARIAARFDLSLVHVVPTAWDWCFSNLKSGCFVMITLTDERTVVGYYGTKSFSSSDGGERDLYLEEEWDWEAEQGWKERPERVAILVPGREIKFVEIWHPSKEKLDVK